MSINSLGTMRRSTARRTLGAAGKYLGAGAGGSGGRVKARSQLNRKEPIALQEHVVFYVTLLDRCIRQLDDTRTIMTIGCASL